MKNQWRSLHSWVRGPGPAKRSQNQQHRVSATSPKPDFRLAASSAVLLCHRQTSPGHPSSGLVPCVQVICSLLHPDLKAVDSFVESPALNALRS